MRQMTPAEAYSILAEPPKPSRLRSMRLLPKLRRDGTLTKGPPELHPIHRDAVVDHAP